MMVNLSKIRVLIALVAIGAASVVGVATAAPPDQAQNEHQRVIDFWTNARVAQAVPRDFVFDGNRFVPVDPNKGGNSNKGGPPGGGGGGGGGSTTVTGASWTKGGLVQETTGKVLFALGSSYYVCSASVVTDNDLTDSDSLILTAAHCAYDETTGQFATNWMFVPNYDAAPATLTRSGSFCASTEHGCWVADALTVHSGFADAGGFNSIAVRYDFAVATVHLGGLDDATKLDATLGAQAIAFSELSTPWQAYAFGYPAAQKYKGKDLVYCAGPTSTDANMNNATYRLVCDMTGGSSGGPWFSGFNANLGTGTVSSLNSYGYTGGDSMYGPKLNSDTNAVYTAANNRISGNLVVTTP